MSKVGVHVRVIVTSVLGTGDALFVAETCNWWFSLQIWTERSQRLYKRDLQTERTVERIHTFLVELPGTFKSHSERLL